MGVAGFTGWAGEHNGQQVSFGWDWRRVRDLLVILSANELRTNVRLINDAGDDLPLDQSKAYLAEWLETQPWRDVVRHVILTYPLPD